VKARRREGTAFSQATPALSNLNRVKISYKCVEITVSKRLGRGAINGC